MGVEMNPVVISAHILQVTSIEDENKSTDSLSSTAGRGVKRKASESYELDWTSTPSGNQSGITSPQPTHQQEMIFNMSLCKLNHSHKVGDPSLCRSVLICNTIRRIERELQNVSISTSEVSVSSPMTAENNNNKSVYHKISDTGALPPVDTDDTSFKGEIFSLASGSSITNGANINLDPFNISSTEKCVTEWSGSLSAKPEIHQPLPPISSFINSPQIDWSSVLNFTNDMGPANTNCETSFLKAQTLLPNSIPPAADNIFDDIDLSLYDFDLLPMSPPANNTGCGNHVGPLTAEELLRLYPAGATPKVYYRTEKTSTSEELDNLIQISVSS